MIWRPWKGTGPRSAVSQHSPGLLMTHLTRSFPPAWPCKTGPGRSDGFWRKGSWAAFIAAPRPALWPLTPARGSVHSLCLSEDRSLGRQDCIILFGSIRRPFLVTHRAESWPSLLARSVQGTFLKWACASVCPLVQVS